MTDKPIVRVPANLEGPAYTADGFMSDGLANFVSRIGTRSDKSSHAFYAWSPWAYMDVDAAYRTSWFRKICDIPPFDEVREGRTWTGADKDAITKIDETEKRIGLMDSIKEARTYARKDGGAAIVIGTGGNAATELNPDSIGEGGLKYISVCTKWDIQPQDQDRDPESPTFKKPGKYILRNTAFTEVHPSRVIRFIGNPIRQMGYWDGWGESIWVELRNAVRHADQIAAGVSSMVDEAKLDVVSIKNLIGGLATAEYESALLSRWTSMMAFKSMNNTLLLDGSDEYIQKTLSFAGLPDIQDRALMIMSGMADIPATRLLGRSPQGMNATGDSDMRNYYDRIRAGQKMLLSPMLVNLDKIIVRSSLGDYPDGTYNEWNPLYSLSEAEAATVEKQFADSAKVYADTGLLPEPALAKIVQDGIVERGQWPGADQAFIDADKAGELPPLLQEPTEAELAEEAAKVAMANQVVADPAGAARPKPKLVASRDARFTDATPRSLYVRRDLVNVAEVRKWAASQGLTLQDGAHVTIASSRTPIDWMEMGASWSAKLDIPAGGPRVVERLGDRDQWIVLLFTDWSLVSRHEDAKRAGASWDFAKFQPHFSIQKDEEQEIDVTTIKPYQGKIVLGPEIFEERKID